MYDLQCGVYFRGPFCLCLCLLWFSGCVWSVVGIGRFVLLGVWGGVSFPMCVLYMFPVPGADEFPFSAHRGPGAFGVSLVDLNAGG